MYCRYLEVWPRPIGYVYFMFSDIPSKQASKWYNISNPRNSRYRMNYVTVPISTFQAQLQLSLVAQWVQLLTLHILKIPTTAPQAQRRNRNIKRILPLKTKPLDQHYSRYSDLSFFPQPTRFLRLARSVCFESLIKPLKSTNIPINQFWIWAFTHPYSCLILTPGWNIRIPSVLRQESHSGSRLGRGRWEFLAARTRSRHHDGEYCYGGMIHE
jgi:hypothetical protein